MKAKRRKSNLSLAKNFLQSLLNPDPKKRPTPGESLEHEFFTTKPQSIYSNYSSSTRKRRLNSPASKKSKKGTSSSGYSGFRGFKCSSIAASAGGSTRKISRNKKNLSGFTPPVVNWKLTVKETSKGSICSDSDDNSFGNAFPILKNSNFA